MLKSLVILFFILLGFIGFAQPNPRGTSDDIVDSYLDQTYILVQNTVGFSAPVSARGYMYIAIGAYEGICLTRNKEGLEAKLTQFNSFSNELKRASTIEPVVLNRIFYDLLSYFFRGASVHELNQLSNIYNEFKQPFSSDELFNLSEQTGQVIAKEIIKWSKLDGGDEGYLNNFPEGFKIQSCDSCWARTTPGYLPALLPYWGDNVTKLSNTREIVAAYRTMPFSTDTASVLYKNAVEVLANSKEMNPDYERIAEYWDNAPGISGTPAGHFFQLAAGMAKRKSMDLEQKLEMYALLGIALNEAMIVAWELKYRHNFIRPITYIQRYVDSHFNTRIDTPPFPESPSGHSFQSGAGGEILKAYFGNEVEISDSTHIQRKDMDGSPVNFYKISDLMKEISNSRLYGGIHFRETLDSSLEFGRKIGINVLEKLKRAE